MNITRTSHELTTTEYIDRGTVVVCDVRWMSHELGSHWELDRIEITREMERTGHGGFATAGEPDFHAYGCKLTKKGVRRTGVAHLLPWIHSAEDLARCTITEAVA